MRIKRPRHVWTLLILLTAALIAEGCAMRPRNAGTAGYQTSATPSPATPVPTEAIYYTVEYRFGDEILSREKVLSGAHSVPPGEIPGTRLLGWAMEDGQPAQPGNSPVEKDAVYYAVARPLLRRSSPFLYPDEYGLLRPDSSLSAADAAQAMRSLLPDTVWVQDLMDRWDAAPEEAVTMEDFLSALNAVFTPEEIASVQDLIPETETLTRSQAAVLLVRLLDFPAGEILYYPDLSPSHYALDALSAAAVPGTLTPEAITEQTQDGFLWFDGYLYRPDESGYFITDQEFDSLYFDANGRYTSGNQELDGYVAATIAEYTLPDKTRLENLHELYFHVKNDFEYLRRNYYASGATGWDIEEALTIFRTNKGNCYCYAGAFCALARGMGYNAVTYSGTIGIQEQAHAWTEITLDDEIYICDPEIEMNYWVWLKEYTDNFMMRREKSGGWNYIAMGRTVNYE